MAPPKPNEAFRAFHNKSTDDRSLIWRTEHDKGLISGVISTADVKQWKQNIRNNEP